MRIEALVLCLVFGLQLVGQEVYKRDQLISPPRFQVGDAWRDVTQFKLTQVIRTPKGDLDFSQGDRQIFTNEVTGVDANGAITGVWRFYKEANVIMPRGTVLPRGHSGRHVQLERRGDETIVTGYRVTNGNKVKVALSPKSMDELQAERFRFDQEHYESLLEILPEDVALGFTVEYPRELLARLTGLGRSSSGRMACGS